VGHLKYARRDKLPGNNTKLNDRWY